MNSIQKAIQKVLIENNEIVFTDLPLALQRYINTVQILGLFSLVFVILCVIAILNEFKNRYILNVNPPMFVIFMGILSLEIMCGVCFIVLAIKATFFTRDFLLCMYL